MGWFASYCYNQTTVDVRICVNQDCGAWTEATIPPSGYVKLEYGKSKSFTVIVESIGGNRHAVESLSLRMTPKKDCTVKMGAENCHIVLVNNSDGKGSAGRSPSSRVLDFNAVFFNEVNLLNKYEVSAVEALIALHDEITATGDRRLHLAPLHRRIADANTRHQPSIRCDGVLPMVHNYTNLLEQFATVILQLNVQRASNATRQLLHHAELYVIENVNNYAASLSHFPADARNENRAAHFQIWHHWLSIAIALFRELDRDEIVLRLVDKGENRPTLSYKIDTAGRNFLGGLSSEQIAIKLKEMRTSDDILRYLRRAFVDGHPYRQ